MHEDSLDSAKKPHSLEEAMRMALAERGLLTEDPQTGDEADPRELGRDSALLPPQEPDAYIIRIPRDAEHDPFLEARARRWFHAAGLPQGTVNGILHEYVRHIAMADADEATLDARRESCRQQLRKEWGSAYEQKLQYARAALNAFKGGEELHDLICQSGLGDSAWFISTLAALGEGRQPSPTGE